MTAAARLLRTLILPALLAATPAWAGTDLPIDDPGPVLALSARPADLDARIAAFERETGIDLHVMGDRTEPPMADDPDLAPVDPALAAALLPVIEEVLMQYPTFIRGGLVEDLYLYGKLRMGGKPFLGAARPDKRAFLLAIRARTDEPGLRSTLHHELAHLIEGHDDFDGKAWTALSAPYNGKLDQQTETKDLRPEHWWKLGFVSRYASKNRHEDFAEMAEVAFTQPRKIQDLRARYDVIDAKLELMTATYEHFAPGMDLPWTDRPARVDPPVKARPPEVTAPPEPEPEPEAEPVGDTGGPDSTDAPDTDAAPVAKAGGRKRVDDKGNPVRR